MRFIWYNDYTLIIKPQTLLKADTEYIVQVTQSARDNSTPGLELDRDYQFTFRTVFVRPDETPPIVLNTIPSDGSINVPVRIKITIYFSKEMDVQSVQENFQITPTTNGTLSWFDKNLTFTPDTGLKVGTKYTITLKKYSMDTTFTTLTDDYTFSFTTASDLNIGSLSGYVKDNRTRNPLTNVTITIFNAGTTSIVKTIKSSFDGSFFITGLQEGKYDVKFSFSGYDDKLAKNVIVKPGEDTSMEILMEKSGPKPQSDPLFWYKVLAGLIAGVVAFILLVVAYRKYKKAPKIVRRRMPLRAHGKATPLQSKGAVPPAGKLPSPKCVICTIPVKKGDMIYRCVRCSNLSHANCISITRICPVCGTGLPGKS